MSLVKHTIKELKIAGLFDKDSDYDGEIGKAVLELIRVFSKQGHSGMSARLTLQIFDKVARFKPLTPISSNPKEWMKVDRDMWQNTRQSSCFSKDRGKTWYDLDAPKKKKWYEFWRR